MVVKVITMEELTYQVLRIIFLNIAASSRIIEIQSNLKKLVEPAIHVNDQKLNQHYLKLVDHQPKPADTISITWSQVLQALTL